MRRYNFWRMVAFLLAVVVLIVGTAPMFVVLAGPKEGKDRVATDDPPISESGDVVASLDLGSASVTEEEAPSLDFGSAAAGESVAPSGRVETIEPTIEEPTQEQVAAVQEPLVTEELPVDEVGERDSDDDKIPDAIDNCPYVYNIDQSDADADGIGNVCQEAPEQDTGSPADTDGDGVPDESDNCWQLANPSQKDGDGDGLGNGCDEGSAPFLTPDQDEIVEAQRYVQDPTLTTGSPAGRPAAAPESSDGSDGPIGVVAGETLAAPAPEASATEGASVGDRNDRSAAAPADSADSAVETTGQSQQEKQRDRRNTQDGDSNASDNADRAEKKDSLSKVQQGQRPRRNPALTEESGPVLPPPRSAKRYPLEPGFETVMRIDAGALGSKSDQKSSKRNRDEPATDRRKRETTDASAGSSRGENRSRSEAELPVEDSGKDNGRASSPAESGRARNNGPVPIEAGVVLGNPPPADRGGDVEEQDGQPTNGADAAVDPPERFGWQSPDLDPAAATDVEAGDESPTGDPDRGDVKTRKGDKGDEKRRQKRPQWDSDRHYRGGEATRYAKTGDVAGTSEDDLYLTQRSGKGDRPDRFVYAIPVDVDGIFRVRLHFAESSLGVADGEEGRVGARVFDVDAEGEPALDAFDIYDEVGSMTAVVKMFDVEVDDGTLELEFRGRKGQPVISAIEVLRHVDDVKADSRKAGKANWSGIDLSRLMP